jgi:DNA-binding Lrp family transcriptional regulator
MLPPNEIDVLVSLFPERRPCTLKELQDRCGYSYERVHSAVKSLEKKGIIKAGRYGNVIVACPNYSSDYSFLGFVYHMVRKKDLLLRAQRLANKGKPVLSAEGAEKSADVVGAISEIEGLNAETLAILEISREAKPKISLIFTKDRNAIDNILKIEYRRNLRIDATMETEETLRKKKEDPRYLNCVVFKGFEHFYNYYYR